MCWNTKHWKSIALAQLAIVVLGLDVTMLPIMSHGADSVECEDAGHSARLNKETDAGAELAARLPIPVCWDQDICDVAGATNRAAMQYEDALRVAAAGSRQASTKALIVAQSEWRDALIASITVRIGVKTMWGSEGPEKHTSDYIREKELASWLKM